ncbi:MAG: DUF2225 domain-containing protein [Candidatus Muiribacteriota bacterium]
MSLKDKKKVPATWPKEVQCPVCTKNFNVEMIRTSRVRVIENYDDLGRKYSKDINPLLYSTWTCPKCLYSGNKEKEYFKIIPELKVRVLKHHPFFKKIAGNTDFTASRTAESAIKSLLLSTLCYKIRKLSRGFSASCFMRIAWIIRNEEKPFSEEKPFLQKAVRDYVHALKKEYSPNFGKLSEYGIFYLIGLLYYKLGDIEQAREYISQVILHKKKIEPLIVKKAQLLFDDIKDYKELNLEVEEIGETDEVAKDSWINELDLTLE